MRIPVDEYFMNVAYAVSQRATCGRRIVGCILSDSHNRIMATGFNGVAAGEAHCYQSPCGGLNYASGTGLDLCRAIHAEQNALMYCRDPYSIATCTTTTFPCIQCLKMLLNTSCKTIYYHEKYNNTDGIAMWRNAGRDMKQVNPSKYILDFADHVRQTIKGAYQSRQVVL